MTRFVSLQTNFSSGAMDPLLLSRVDLAAYQNALSEAKNVVIQPQGGARRRSGLKYLRNNHLSRKLFLDTLRKVFSVILF